MRRILVLLLLGLSSNVGCNQTAPTNTGKSGVHIDIEPKGPGKVKVDVEKKPG